MTDRISISLYSDPGCPWGYSANPALRALEWRYGDQLDWRLHLIGLAEDPATYLDKGFTPAKMTRFQAGMRRFGMPFLLEEKSRMSATSPACRIVVAARLDAPGTEWQVFRALQLAQFTSDVLLDDLDGMRTTLEAARLEGVDPAVLVSRVDDADVRAAYEEDRSAARSAAGTPGALQGKTATTPEGVERYTAPSVVFERAGVRLEAGGFQTIEAYDVLVANLNPALDRTAPATDAAQVLERFPHGLVTQEVAAVMQQGSDPVDRTGAELALLDLVSEGRARREQLGDDARWWWIG